MIYLDNAATSYPKPQIVINAVKNSFNKYPSNPGRSGYKSTIKTTEMVYEARYKLDCFFNGFGCENAIFTNNCTQALNMAVKGYVKPGSHIVISSLEHNSVLRPVHQLYEQGVADYSVFKVTDNDDETVENFKNAFKDNTSLCVVTAVSNVFGTVLPLKKLSETAHSRGVRFFVDGAQGAGVIPLDMQNMGIDCLCVPGHKGLLGPMGTGALLHNDIDFTPLLCGGTGSKSLLAEQPDEYPDRLESGTLNVPGICGLLEGLRFIEKTGFDIIMKKEKTLTEKLVNGLRNIEGVVVYGDYKHTFAPVVSFCVNGIHSETVSNELSKYDVAVRGGYHCSLFAHKYMGTTEFGTVRVSPSFFTSEKDIKILLNLVRKIAISNFI